MAEQADMKRNVRVVKEGLLHKKTSLLRQWRPRFVVLNRQLLCIFKKEEDEKRGRTADGRIFLIDIETIEKFETKKRKHCFSLNVGGKPFFSFCCSSAIDREVWIRSIQLAKETELKEEETDPIRRKSIKLTGGLKRITIPREKGQGLGCTIKNVGGVIFVNRILEDGPVSTSGILRPGDQILDINGIDIGGRSVSEISEIIKGSPEIVVCTVKPSSDYRYCDTGQVGGHTEYAEIDLDSLKAKNNFEDNEGVSKNGSIDRHKEHLYVKPEPQKRHSLPSVLPDAVSETGTSQSDKDCTLNYLELNFGERRQRNKSDVSRSPRVPPRINKPQSKPAYIELEFDAQGSKRQFSTSASNSSAGGVGDRKSNSLPRH